MALTSFELRRAALIARTFIPRGVLGGTTDDLDAAALILEDDSHSPWHASFLLRFGVWLVWLWPLLSLSGLRSFGASTEQQREDQLDAMLHHRAYTVRQTVMYLKLVSCSSLLGSIKVLTHLNAYHFAEPSHPSTQQAQQLQQVQQLGTRGARP